MICALLGVSVNIKAGIHHWNCPDHSCNTIDRQCWKQHEVKSGGVLCLLMPGAWMSGGTKAHCHFGSVIIILAIFLYHSCPNSGVSFIIHYKLPMYSMIWYINVNFPWRPFVFSLVAIINETNMFHTTKLIIFLCWYYLYYANQKYWNRYCVNC